MWGKFGKRAVALMIRTALAVGGWMECSQGTNDTPIRSVHRHFWTNMFSADGSVFCGIHLL